MAGRAAREILVEGGTYQARRGPPGRSDDQLAPIEADDAVLCHGGKPFQRAAEIGIGCVEFRGDAAKVNLELAHQPLDDRAAESIVLAERDAARDRQFAPCQGASIGRYGHQILDITVRQRANGGSAQTDKGGGPIGSVALEIARHVARRRRPGLQTVFMTGYSDQSVYEYGILLADDGLLKKPFSARALLQRVADALGSRPAAPAAATA